MFNVATYLVGSPHLRDPLCTPPRGGCAEIAFLGGGVWGEAPPHLWGACGGPPHVGGYALTRTCCVFA